MPAAERQALKVRLESLSEFKKRVDAALSDFEGSQGSAQKVGAHRLSEASFSGAGGFAEAKGLHAQYERVHERLTALSKNLGLQIEALQIAVIGAGDNFSDLDEEQRRRFWEIQTGIDREWRDAQREKDAAEAEKQGKSAPKSNDERTVTY
ncbi:hypothetical protein AB0E64_11020 [Streptomyces caelestis]|uniref:Uncharacterized protein n=1 Tax=Streptomyces caelestis TaxID=36816 RepID=A0A7W9H9P1_9ACTN|nr:hypothetical protein [Streptomyces caelestis]MBB5797889.1 hypothetical protein [Streptomyces caelestis]GGW69390.1 hypothetical protein GCM10010320_58600 [Streptomyces caelestis]